MLDVLKKNLARWINNITVGGEYIMMMLIALLVAVLNIVLDAVFILLHH